MLMHLDLFVAYCILGNKAIFILVLFTCRFFLSGGIFQLNLFMKPLLFLKPTQNPSYFIKFNK